MSDRAIQQRLIDGDRAAFADIYAALDPTMKRVARSITGNAATADEVTQDAWLAVINNLATFKGDAPLRHWILKILANKARSRARRDGRTTSLDLGGEQPTYPADKFSGSGDWATPPALWDRLTPERILAGQQTWQIVQQAITALPAAQQAVLGLLEQEKLSAKDCAEILGISAQNVRVLLHRARNTLRAVLDAEIAGCKKIENNL